jgi:hypothetical protein
MAEEMSFNAMKKAAKGYGLRCFNLMKREELVEALALAVKQGRTTEDEARLLEIQAVARARFKKPVAKV